MSLCLCMMQAYDKIWLPYPFALPHLVCRVLSTVIYFPVTP